MSDERSRLFSDEKTTKRFQLWREAFERLRKKRMADYEFSEVLEAGCDAEDLERTLFNVILWYEHSREGPKQTKLFFGTLERVLSDLSRLETSLTSLVNLPYRSGSHLRACLDYLGPVSEEVVAYRLPRLRGGPRTRLDFLRSGMNEELAVMQQLALLHDLSNRLEMIRELGLETAGPASTASEPEALLLRYVQKFTKEKFSFKHVSALLSAACHAHEMKARSYDLESFGRRYNRFRKKKPQTIKFIDFVLDHYYNMKSQGSRKTDLITYYYECQLTLGRTLTGERLGRQGQNL